MAKRAVPSDDAITQGNALMRVEVERYVQNTKTASLYNKLSEYMFWGATTVLAGFIAGVTGLGGATLAGGAMVMGFPVLAVVGLAVSAAAFAGSVLFSRSAANIEAHNSVLHTDIDSHSQSRRIVQAFAKAQAAGVDAPDEALYVPGDKSWVERSGAPETARSGNWANRVEADRQLEEQTALSTLARR